MLSQKLIQLTKLCFVNHFFSFSDFITEQVSHLVNVLSFHNKDVLKFMIQQIKIGYTIGVHRVAEKGGEWVGY